MTKGLALSGGGARGSFQVGALECLYTVFGYRPDVIAGTSVGSINGLVLAQGQTPDEKLTQLQTLLGIWRALTRPRDFYAVRQWFADLTGSDSLDLSEGIGGLSVRLEDAIMEILFNNLINNAMRSTSLAKLDPIEAKMRTPQMVDETKLASGVPLRMLCVSLESGRVRYATGRGVFIEDDNFTPVASALPRVAAIVGPHDAFTGAVTSVRTIMDAIEKARNDPPHDIKWKNVARLDLALERARWRADAAFDDLADANAALPNPIEARVDPIIGALASAAMPGIFGPYPIGNEHYVDGGLRDTVPVRTAVQMGATEVIAIVCSTQTLPRAGYAGSQNFLSNLLGSLADIALKEIVEDDLGGRGIGAVPVTTIIPSFNVHDTAAVDMGLIHISMAYGFMRAADVISPLGAAARRNAQLLSDAITSLRTDTHRLSYLWTRPLQAEAHQVLLELRLRKWLIRKLVESRIVSGVALPQYAMLWFQGWEQGSSGIPNIPNPWQRFVTAAQATPDVDPFSYVTATQTTPAVDPYTYVPDGWVYEEKGDLAGVYLIRAGAAFRGTAATMAALTGSGPVPTLTVPEGTTANLPAVPVAGTVLAEQAPLGMNVQTPGTWVVDGTRRYLVNPAAATALGATATAFVPVGGLAQIPDGGSPYWLGGLVIADSQPSLIHRWELTPQVEGSRTLTTLFLWNRSNRNVTVADVRITTPFDTATSPLFTVRTPRPFSVPVGQLFSVDVQFDATTPGPLVGVVAVDCDDPIAPVLRLPLATSVRPLGRHAELQVSPASVDLGRTLVPVTVGQSLTITNTGSRPAGVGAVIVGEQPPGQFAVSTYSLTSPLPPGQATSVFVSYTPTTRGAARATVAIDLVSDTDVANVHYHRRYEVPLTGTATMPILLLAGGPVRRRPPRPVLTPPILVGLAAPSILRPIPMQEVELTTLDFGTGPVNSLVPGSFWVQNVGDAPLTVAGVVVVNQSSFGIVNAAMFPITLQPGGEIEVPSVFNAGPVPGRTLASEFWVGSDDPLRPSAMLAVVGQAAGPHLTEPSEMLDLGPVTAPISATLTFTSDGSDPVTIKELRLTSGQDFTVSSVPTIPTQLAPGNSLVVTVTLVATASGLYEDQLIMTHTGKLSQQSSVLLRAVVQ